MDTGLQFANAEAEDLKTQSRKEILISKGLVVLSFREFIASEEKKKAPRAPSSRVSLDILIGNGSLKLL